MQLYIGNKNYSSWSMRPWVLMRQAGIAFDEVMLRFDGFGADSEFKTRLLRVSPAGRVPVLVDDGFVVWDTLAIAEYLADRFPDKALWPRDMKQRARARCACAEMHSGFAALRSQLPMNIEAKLPDVGARVLRDEDAARTDVERMTRLWGELLEASGGPLLFGEFSVADAYFAPVVMRFRSYAVPLPAAVAAYVDRVAALPGVADWVQGALAEHDFLAFEEPYREAPKP